MIQSFGNKTAQDIFNGVDSRDARRLPVNLHKVAGRKLDAVESAIRLEDLKLPPGNRLEALKGDRDGEHSIRINDQWRVVFVWKDGHACNVKVEDYH